MNIDHGGSWSSRQPRGRALKVMHIDASVREAGSSSRNLSHRVVAGLQRANTETSVDRLDLAFASPAHLDLKYASAIYLSAEDHDDEQRTTIAESDALCARVLGVDALVIGTPIYNFGMPSSLKAFFDRVVRADVTFRADETGFHGLLSGKRAVCIISGGGDYTPGAAFEGMDHLTPHLATLLRFLGIVEPAFILARPTLLAEDHRKIAVLREAEQEADRLVETWLGEIGAG